MLCQRRDISAMERRKLIRHPFRTEIEYVQKGHQFQRVLTDISLPGLFIDTLSEARIGDELTFTFSLPGSDRVPIEGAGVVVWIEDFTGIGIRFTNMLKKDWTALSDYLRNL